MSIFSFPPKFPEEKIVGLYFNFVNRLMPGEIITNANVVSTPEIHSNTQYLETTVSFDVSGGKTGDVCQIVVTATGSMGSIREAKGSLVIL